MCKTCGLIGHTIKRCFGLIGNPIGFKRNHNLSKQSGKVKNFHGNAEVNQTASTSSVFFDKWVYDETS